jgi:hypothetical protein
MTRGMDARYIKAETICIGDTVRVSHDELDSTVSIVGVVGKRERRGRETEYFTTGGRLLLTTIYGATARTRTITLLDRVVTNTQTELEGMGI